MAISDRLNKLTTDITNAYTSIENKLPKILPEGYTQVEYIESTGTQYIDTGIIANNNIKIETKVETTTIQQDISVFGCYINSTSIGSLASYYHLTPYNNKWYFGTNGSERNAGTYSNVIGTQYNIAFNDESGNIIINNETIFTNGTYTSPENSTLTINRRGDNISYRYGQYKIYNFKVYDKSISKYVRNFVPCYRNSDNEIGMYDTVNNVFYTNAGTGTFLKGYDTAIGMDKNTNNLPTAIDSIEVIEQATAEGESLSLANTKAMPYSDYIVKGKSTQEGTPSPSNPSEIHSVADDVNLFDIENLTSSTAEQTATGIIINNTIKVVLTTDGTYKYASWYINNVNDWLGKTLTISCIATPSSNNNGRILLRWFKSGYMGNTIANLPATGGTFDIPSTIPSGMDTILISFYANQNSASHSTNDYVEYTNIKIQEGSIATPYSPYNQGTVTIKQRGKNLFDIEKWVLQGNNSNYYSYSNGILSINALDTRSFLNFSESEKIYLPNGNYYLSNIGNAGIRIYNRGSDYGTITNEFTVTLGYIYLKLVSSSAITCQPMIEQGSTATPYEEYQGYDKMFQTEPLRSLPNGVKDTIDTQQHRKIGTYVFNGTEFCEKYAGSTYAFTVYLPVGVPDIKHLASVDRVLCSHLQHTHLEDIWRKRESSGYNLISTQGIRTFAIMINNYTSTTELQTYLAQQYANGTPVIIQYELNEEIIEPLTQNQATTMLDIIKTGSYEGTTNIYTDEDVKPTIGVGYYKKG